MVRTSLKKHDATEASRSTKARRVRQSNDMRKDKRRDTIQTKRRRPSVPPVLTTSSDPHTPLRDIDELIHLLTKSSKEKDKIQVLKEIRMLLSTHEHDYEVLEKITDSGVVPVLVDLLNHGQTSEVYQEILWCLTNVASGQYEHTKLVLPAVPRLLELIDNSSTPLLADHAAWVLGNIAADCEEFRQQLIANGAIVPLTKQLAQSLQASSYQLAENCAWALSNLARGHDTPGIPFIEGGILSIIVEALQKNQFNQQALMEIAWFLSFLTAKEEQSLQNVLESPLIHALLPFFKEENELVLTPILRVFGNICCGSMDHHTDAWQLPFVEKLVQTKGFLTQLVKCLSSSKIEQSHLIAESAWVVSNLAALNQKIVLLLVQEAKVLPILGNLFHHGTYEIRKEVAFALTNIALTSKQLLDQVLALDVLKGFLQFLASAADVAVVGNSLRLIENILRSGKEGVHLIEQHEGIDALETVQFQAQEPHLAQWAEALVNEFYGENYGTEQGGSPVKAQPVGEVGPGGRGRGAHLTKPAWMKQ